MDYEDMIEEEPQPVEDPPVSKTELDPVEARAKSPWKAFILTGFLAGGMGALGGGYGVYAGLKHLSPAAEAQPQVDLSPIERRMKQLTDRVSAAEAVTLEAANNPTVEFEPVDMSVIEDRLAALESAPSPEIDPDALKALQAAQADGFEWPDMSAFEDRVASLETKAETPPKTEMTKGLRDRLTALETDVEIVKNADPVTVPMVDEDMLSNMDSRLTALENRPAPNPVVKRVSILAFPKSLMVEAIENNTEGGLIKKTLSRHIRVKDANDPLTLVEGIESDISEGLLAAAVEKFERLPPPVRSVGQAWYESVKASL